MFKENNILVSIIMPAYNAEKYIANSINSVINQTFTNWELIIVDDGSTDNTSKIINKFVINDNRIFYYYQSNKKQGKARNLAISKSKGKYLAFLDADDLWFSNKLSVQIEEINSTNVDLLFSNIDFINEYSLPITNFKHIPYVGFIYGIKGFEQMLEFNKISMPSVFVKKEVVISSGNFSETHDIQDVEDYHLWLQLLANGYKFYGSNKILACYRVQNESASNTKSIEKKIAFERKVKNVRIYFAKLYCPKKINQINSQFKYNVLKIHYKNNSDKFYFVKLYLNYIFTNKNIRSSLRVTKWLYKKLTVSDNI